jgi:MFS family permease
MSHQAVEHRAESVRTPDEPNVRGWIVVWVCCVAQGLVVGSQFVFSLLIAPFREIFSASDGGVLLATVGMLTLGTVVLAPLSGLMVRRYSARGVLIFSIVSMGAGYCAVAVAQNLWQLGAIYVLPLAFGSSAVTVAAATLVSNWFDHNRGRAMGVAMAGMCGFGVIFPPVAAHVFDQYGIRLTLAGLGLIILLSAPVAMWLVRERPNASAAEPASTERAGRGSAKVVLSSARFWIIAPIAAICAAGSNVPAAVLAALGLDWGIDATSSAYLVSAFAISATIGMISFGVVSDRLSPRSSAHLVTATIAAAVLLLAFGRSYPFMALGSVVLGLGGGGAIILPTVLLSTYFKGGDYAFSIGAQTALGGLMSAVGAISFGVAHDAMGDYVEAMLALVAALGIAALIAFGLPSRQRTHS